MAASDCAAGLGLTANQPGTFNNIETDLTAAQASEIVLDDISEIGYALLISDGTFIPIIPFITLGFLIPDLISLFSGRPQSQDTDNVIGAYNDSAYWPLHTLAADLAEALKNGAPISDSRPEIQAEFSQWKQGTIESIQGYAGWTPGASSPGYWQLQRLINASWAFSGAGQPAVLNVVKAIDKFTEILACLKQQQQSAGGGGSGGGGGGGGTTQPPTPVSLCQSGNPDTDEIVDSCIATQTSLQQILAAIQALGSTTAGGEVDACCTAVVNAIASVAAALGNITALLSAPTSPAQPIDLSGIVAAVQELVTAVATFPRILEAIPAALTPQLSAIAEAINNAPGAGTGGIVDQLKQVNANDIIPAAIVDYFVAQNVIPPEVGQLFSDRPWPWLHTVLKGAATISPIVGWLESYLGDDKDAKGGQRQLNAFVDGLLARGAKGLDSWNPTINTKMLTALKALIQAFIKKEDLFVGGLAAPFVDALTVGLTPPGQVQIGNVGLDPDTPINTAASVTLNALLAAWIGSYFGIDEGESLTKLAEYVGGLVGFEELNDVTLGPLIRNGIGKVADLQAKKQFGQELPGAGTLATLAGRRKITGAQYLTWVPFTGLPGELWTQTLQAGYRPVTPFVLASAFVDQPLDRNVILDILQDNAYSDSHANTMADAIVYKSIANVRNAYLSQLITGYGKGVVGDAELQQALTDFNFSPQAQQYVMSHVLILRREVLAAETEKQIVPQIVNGLITPAAAQQQLEIAGVQPWYAELITGLAAVRAEIAVTKKELKAEEKLQAKQQLALQRTALADFANGSINAEALGAALIAAGLDPVVAAAVVAEKSATQLGRLKLVYGQLLTPAEAKLQTERVDAVKNQLKEQLITYQQALAQLKSFGVTSADANAIVAGVAAAIAAASTVGTLLNPLTGLPG